MNRKLPLFATFFAAFLLFAAGTQWAANAPGDDEPYAPHTPTLIFYLTGATSQKDTDAIKASVEKLPGAHVLEVNLNHDYARLRFDSHVISYHQAAQAIADAGTSLGKNYQPCLVFTIADYAKADNAGKVDAIFAGKRLNSRVHVTPLDKSLGKFLVRFLPLKLDPSVTGPQGFNGGHLHHPISDPKPRGLALPSEYASDYDPAVSTTTRPTTQPTR